MIPTPEQEAVIQQIISKGVQSGGALDSSETGTGKTLVGCEVGVRMWAERVLIIAPTSTFDNWEDTLGAQSGQRLRPCGNKKLRGHTAKECKANLAAVLKGESGWFFVGREMFASVDWYTKQVKNSDGEVVGKRTQRRVWQKHLFDYAVYDECQAISNPKSRGAKSWLALNARLKKAQSADWFGNQLPNMHTVARGVWHGAEYVEPNFVAWRDRYLESQPVLTAWGLPVEIARGFDEDGEVIKVGVTKVVGEIIPGEFVSTLPCYVRLESELGAKPEPEKRWVDLSPKQAKLYADLDESDVVWVENNPLVTSLPMHLRIRKRQLTLGMFTVDGEGKVDFPDEGDSTKLDELMSLLADHPDEKFVVFTDSQKFARVATLRLNKAKIRAAEWSGAKTFDARNEVKDQFVNGDLRVIVGVIAALSEGVSDLQYASRNVVFLSRSDDALKNHQSVGRLHRRGQERPVRVWDIMARNSYDNNQVSKLMRKALDNNAAKRLRVPEQIGTL